jgi:hypothetical protein
MKCVNFLPGLLFLLFSSSVAIAQSGTENIGTPERYCSYNGGTILSIKAIHQFRSEEEAREVMNKIVDVVGLRPNFVVRASNVTNAAAWINNSERYVLYNPRFIQNVKVNTRTYWSAISILAHEIGHHLNGHTLTQTGSRPKTELEADEFSGYALRKMGATLDEAQAAMRLLANPYGSPTHPPRYERLQAIQRGWMRADNQLAESATVRPAAQQNDPEQQSPVQTPQVNKPKAPAYAQWRVTMVSNPNSSYYITKQNTFVTVRNGRVYTLGSFLATENADYPFIIKLDNSPDLFVSDKWELVSQKGESIGYLLKD